MSDFQVRDCNGQFSIVAGDFVLVGSPPQFGMVKAISDPDGDYDDELGRNVEVCPRVLVGYERAYDERYTTWNDTPTDWQQFGSPAGEPEAVYICDDLEVIDGIFYLTQQLEEEDTFMPQYDPQVRHDAAVKAAKTKAKNLLVGGFVSGHIDQDELARRLSYSTDGNGDANFSASEIMDIITEARQQAGQTIGAGGAMAATTGSAVPAAAAPQAPTTGLSAAQVAGLKAAGNPTAAQIAAVLAELGHPVAPSPAARKPRQAALYKPTWENDGKVFRIWYPGGQDEVKLDVEEEPGPFTPQEKIHDVLGQPRMLFTIAHAIAAGQGSLLEGPTGTAKTTAYRWFAQQLNWNLITMPVSRDLEEAHMVGEYMPTESVESTEGMQVPFAWTYGPVAKAALESQTKPTILVFEEANRCGSQQVFARIYSLLDDTRELRLSEKRSANGQAEVIKAGRLYVGATMNPAADGYIGTQELDVALGRRFQKKEIVGYPPEAVEVEALMRRVPALEINDAKEMVKVATAIRNKPDEIVFPISFPDLHAWATALPLYGWEDSAVVSIINKATPDDRVGILNLIRLRPTATGNPQPAA